MKVLLLDNVKDTGKKGAIVTVSDGLARNKLIPLKKAIEATPGNLNKYRHLLVVTSAKMESFSIQHILDKQNIDTLIITAKSDSTGTLFQSIHEKDILKALLKYIPKHLHEYITEHLFKNFKPLKKIGAYTIDLGDAHLKVSVQNI